MDTRKRTLRRIGIALMLITLAGIAMAYSVEAQETDIETLAVFGIGFSALLVVISYLPGRARKR